MAIDRQQIIDSCVKFSGYGRINPLDFAIHDIVTMRLGVGGSFFVEPGKDPKSVTSNDVEIFMEAGADGYAELAKIVADRYKLPHEDALFVLKSALEWHIETVKSLA